MATNSRNLSTEISLPSTWSQHEELSAPWLLCGVKGRGVWEGGREPGPASGMLFSSHAVCSAPHRSIQDKLQDNEHFHWGHQVALRWFNTCVPLLGLFFFPFFFLSCFLKQKGMVHCCRPSGHYRWLHMTSHLGSPGIFLSFPDNSSSYGWCFPLLFQEHLQIFFSWEGLDSRPHKPTSKWQ